MDNQIQRRINREIRPIPFSQMRVISIADQTVLTPQTRTAEIRVSKQPMTTERKV
jgi:hypothetical protein